MYADNISRFNSLATVLRPSDVGPTRTNAASLAHFPWPLSTEPGKPADV